MGRIKNVFIISLGDCFVKMGALNFAKRLFMPLGLDPSQPLIPAVLAKAYNPRRIKMTGKLISRFLAHLSR